MMEFITPNMAPIMFMSLIVFLLFGYLGRLLARRLRPVLRHRRRRDGPAAADAAAGAAAAHLRDHAERHAAGDPVLHLHGPDPRALAAWPRTCSTPSASCSARSAAASPIAVILVGAMLAATTGVVAASVISMGLISLPIMLRYGYDRRVAIGRDRGLGHAGADHPAVAGADRPGRPARPQRRRPVQGRLHPRLRADRPVRRSTC